MAHRGIPRWAAAALVGVVVSVVPLVGLAGVGTDAGATPPALVVSTTSLAFGNVTLGDFTTLTFTVTNTSASPDTVTEITGGMASDPYDYYPCPGDRLRGRRQRRITLAGGASCPVDVSFTPGRSATARPVLDHQRHGEL